MSNIVSKVTKKVTLILLLSVVITDAAAYKVAYDKMLDNNKNNMKVIMEEVYQNFQKSITMETDDINKISSDSSLINFITNDNLGYRTAMQKKLSDKLKMYSVKSGNDEHVFLTDKKGIVICDSNTDYINWDYSQFNFVQSALNGQANMSDIFIDSQNGKATIAFVQKVQDDKGNIIGTVGKSIKAEYFSKDLDSFKFLKNGYVFIVDKSKNIIRHPIKYQINKKDNIKELDKIIDGKTVFSKKSANFINYKKDNKSFLAYYISIPQIKSLIILNIDYKDIKSESMMIGLIIIVIFSIMMVIILPVINISIRDSLKSLKPLIKNTIEISKGNLNIDSEIKTDDEIGELSRHFNHMAQSIKALLLEIKSVSNELSAVNGTIVETEGNMINYMDTINTNSTKISESTLTVKNSVKWSFDSFDEIKNNTSHIQSQSNYLLKQANVIKDISQKGICSVENLKGVSTHAREEFNLVNSSFKGLEDNIESIKKIVNLVTSISTETNVLSLNASIEAAKAGAYGKGFEVVANEMRILSDNIKDYMKDINKIIRSIGYNIDKTKGCINSMDSVFVSQNEAVSTTTENYTEVARIIEKIFVSIRNINESIDFLGNKNQNVIKSLSVVNDVASGFNNSICEVNKVIEQQSSETQSMDELVTKLEEVSLELKKSMSKFNI